MNPNQALETTRSGARWRRVDAPFRIGALVLGLVTSVLLVTFGVVLDAPAGSTMTFLALLPVFALIIATASIAGVPPGLRMLYNVLTPVAGALVAVTLVVGTAFFPGSVAWWTPAAMVSAAPFIVIALLHRTQEAGRPVGTAVGADEPGLPPR